jgi:hypothetical protein
MGKRLAADNVLSIDRDLNGKRLAADNGLITERDLNGKTVSKR